MATTRIVILLLSPLLLISTSLHAQDVSSVEKGAANYDWQTCISNKTGTCLNGCQTSTDTDCNHNCKQWASDKCKSEGLREP